MLEDLFKFPIVMVDGNKEEQKERRSQSMALPNDDSLEVDMIIGEAECPYDDFIAISDRWLPNEESFQMALNGKFEACSVLFGQSGTYVVPWPKEKFKKELGKFSAKMQKDEEGGVRILNMTKEEFIDTMKNIDGK